MMGAQSSAQTFDFRMTESMKVAQEISSQLALDEFAASKLLEAALPWDACLAHWNAHRDSLESATISEDELLEAMIPVQTQLDDCRTERTRAIAQVWTASPASRLTDSVCLKSLACCILAFTTASIAWFANLKTETMKQQLPLCMLASPRLCLPAHQLHHRSDPCTRRSIRG